MIDVLIVGQTPPPYTGYNSMIERIVRGHFTKVRIVHVRPDLSKANQEIGYLTPRKVFALFVTIAQIVAWRLRRPFSVLYYAPSGPERLTMYRDLIILNSVRWLFPHLVLHFQSGGVSELYPQLPPLLRWLFRRAFFGADAAIQLSPFAPPDAQRMAAQRQVYLPNGIEDHAKRFVKRSAQAKGPLRLLFVAVLQESKGLLVLLEACAQFIAQGGQLHLNVMGAYRSPLFRSRVEERIADLALSKHVTFLGLRTDDAKWEVYAEANVFCLPSFFEGEAFPVVILEAMQFSLPVIATRWRGIPSMVRDGETGLLVLPQDVSSLVKALMTLAQDRHQAQMMGQRGREIYLHEYTVEQYVHGVEAVFIAVAEQRPAGTAEIL